MPTQAEIQGWFQALPDNGKALSEAGFTSEFLARIEVEDFTLELIVDKQFTAKYIAVGKKLGKDGLEFLCEKNRELLEGLLKKPHFFKDLVCKHNATAVNLLQGNGQYNQLLSSSLRSLSQLGFAPRPFVEAIRARRAGFLQGATQGFFAQVMKRGLATDEEREFAGRLFEHSDAANLALVSRSTWEEALKSQRAVEQKQEEPFKLSA